MPLPNLLIPKKPIYISLAEDVDFFGLFQKISLRYQTCFLAESLGEHHENARYALIGFAPAHVIRAKGARLFFDDIPYEVDNPYQALRKIIPQDCIARRYAGGLFGYMSYESVNYLEPSVKVKVHQQFDQFAFGVYTDGLVFDTMTGQLFYFYYNTNRFEEVRTLLNEPTPTEQMFRAKYLGDTLDGTSHRAMVEKTKEKIRAGNTFQCEVGFKSEYEINGSPLSVYAKLRAVNPSPFMFYLQDDDEIVLGASPELLLQVQNRVIKTVPLAGTTKRGGAVAEDIILARQLLNNHKEIAEHVMLVDLARNDVGRVASVGTVKIENFMDINKYSHVQHIASTVTGILKPGEDMFSALASLMPSGVLSGAPKIESIKIIDDNEEGARGPYGGAVGSFGFNGDCTLAIPIRSLFCKGSYAYTQTSSGIVYDSDPEKEYQEIQHKLRAMQGVLEKFSDI